ncbi:MAG: aminotransferase [Gammaproteobacteria bacterium]|nr:aminotransferase [Gammaproteobacteria bacterium]
MSAEQFDFPAAVRTDLPPPASQWNGFPAFNFVGGHNAPESIPVDDLIAAATAVLQREGATLATYKLESGGLGYKPLRDFLVGKLKRHAGIECSADEILLTSGSLQGMDLINEVLLRPGDTIVIEEANYGGVLSRCRRLGVNMVGVPGDEDGMDMDALERVLDELATAGTPPRYIYTIPTIQNPTATIMSLERRQHMVALAKAHGVPIFEDECYSDLIWDGVRPPAVYAVDDSARTVFLGTFSKSIAPALRVGYVVAPANFLSQLCACKTDAGSGALEQMVLGEYCPQHFDDHVARLNGLLKEKCDVLMEALAEHFGTAAEFNSPKGGIFLWVKFPQQVDTTRLVQIANAESVAVNPGMEWSIEGSDAARAIRICYANPSTDTLRRGVAQLAEICNREFGIPTHIANVDRS